MSNWFCRSLQASGFSSYNYSSRGAPIDLSFFDKIRRKQLVNYYFKDVPFWFRCLCSFRSLLSSLGCALTPILHLLHWYRRRLGVRCSLLPLRLPWYCQILPRWSSQIKPQSLCRYSRAHIWCACSETCRFKHKRYGEDAKTSGFHWGSVVLGSALPWRRDDTGLHLERLLRCSYF